MAVRTTGGFLLLSNLAYVAIQGLGLLAGTSFAARRTRPSTAASIAAEHNAIVFVLVLCLCFFAYYLYAQLHESPEEPHNREAVVMELTNSALLDKSISLTAAFDELWLLSVVSLDGSTGLVPKDWKRQTNALKYFFNAFDYDKNVYINTPELGHLMTDLGERLDKAQLSE